MSLSLSHSPFLFLSRFLFSFVAVAHRQEKETISPSRIREGNTPNALDSPMSLFDLEESDNPGSGEERSSGGSSSESDSPLLAPPAPQPPKRGPGRNTLTEADVRSAAAQRRAELEQRLSFRCPARRGLSGFSLSHANPPRSGGEPGSGGDASVFGSSIAAALQLRKAEQEKLLLKRIQKAKERDAEDASLVEKDLEVGVFVTTAYKQMLRRHRGAHGSSTAEKGVDGKASEGHARECEGDNDDDDDPLETYLRKLEKAKEQRPSGADRAISAADSNGAGGAAADFYDTMVLAELREAQRRQQTDERPQQHVLADPRSVSSGPIREGVSPSAEEPQRLQPGTEVAPVSSADRERVGTAGVSSQPPTDAAPPGAVSAREEYGNVLRAARESRKRRRAGADVVEACTRRAVERMERCLGIVT